MNVVSILKLLFRFNWLRKDQKDKEEVCYGTDLNRNWNHNWNEKGSSKSKCSEFYAGPKAFSEPEIKSLSKFLADEKENIKVYNKNPDSISTLRTIPFSFIAILNFQTDILESSLIWSNNLVSESSKCFVQFHQIGRFTGHGPCSIGITSR